MSLISYFGKGENRERYLGVKIPPTNLKPDYLEQAQAFATGLADHVIGRPVETGQRGSSRGAERATDGHDEGEQHMSDAGD